MRIPSFLRSIFGKQKTEKKPNEPQKSKSVVHERLPICALESLGQKHFDHALEFWFANRQGDAPPDWSSFQPGQHPSLLPHIILYEKVDGRYFTRLTGDTVSSYLSEKAAGKFLDEITPRDKLEDVVMRLDRTLSDGLPNYVEKVRLWQEDSRAFGYNALSMPFDSKDKGLTRVLCVLQFKSNSAQE